MNERRAVLQQQRSAALQAISEISSQLHDLDEMDRLRHRIEEYDKSLAEYPRDLDEQVESVIAEVRRLEELSSAVSSLRHYSDARDEWVDANRRGEEAAARAVEIKEAISTVSDQHKEI